MKAFEKWFNNTDDSICSECGGGFIPARDVWKAALKWALEEGDNVYCLEYWIKKELEEELGTIKPSEKEV